MVKRSCLWLVTLVLAACTVDAAVLVVPDAGGVRSCEQAWALGKGARCQGSFSCQRPLEDPAGCCTEYLECKADELRAPDPFCSPLCKPCQTDFECPFGEAICDGETCQECLFNCPDCEDGFAPLLRNGCPTCFCAPPTECSAPDQCGQDEVCHLGITCAPDCAKEDYGCCANACASPDPPCPGLAPVGCRMDCPAGSPCFACAAMHCECAAGEWRCDPGCTLTPNDICRTE